MLPRTDNAAWRCRIGNFGLGLVLLAALLVSAIAADLDTNFDADARVFGIGFAVAAQPDGKIVVGGNFSRADRGVASYLARFNSDGTVDSSFNIGTSLNGIVRCIAVQTDGKILVGGVFTTYGATSRNSIARLNTDGSLDTTFDPGTGFNGEVISLALQSDGKIIAVGAFTTFNGTTRNRVARLTTAGAYDTTFVTGTGASDTIWDVALQADGKPVIVGRFTSYNGTARNRVARLLTTGGLDTTFNPGTGASSDVTAIALDSAGRAVIGGLFNTFNGTARVSLARLTTAGALDTTFGSTTVFTNGTSNITDLKLDSAERILISGDFYPPYQINYNTPALGLARINADGNAIDEAFLVPEAAWEFSRPALSFRRILGLAVGADDGVLAVGGMFDKVTGQAGLLRVSNTGARDAAFNGRTGLTFPPNINAVRRGAGGKYYVAGAFDWIGGAPRADLARFLPNGRIDPAFFSSSFHYTDNQIHEVLELADGTVWVFGPFTAISTSPRAGAALLSTTGSLRSLTPQLAVTGGNVVRALTTSSGSIVLAGSFTQVNATARAGVARVSAAGVLDTAFAPGSGPAGGSIYDAALDAGDQVILGGAFTSFSGTSEANIVRLTTTGAVDSAFAGNTNVSAAVNSVQVVPDGKILLGGIFANSGGFAVNGIDRLNPDGTSDATFNPAPGANSYVYRASRTADGSVLVAGAFTAMQNQARSTLARLTANGPVDALFATDTVAGGYPSDFLELPDGKILLRGTFTSISGATRNGLARFHSATQRRGSLESAMNGATLANNTINAVVPLADGRFVIAGDFTTVSGLSRSRVAAVNVYGEVDTAFTVGTGFNGIVLGGSLLPSGKILLWGSFSTYNNSVAPGIVRLNTDGTIDSTFTPPVFNSAVNTVHVLADGRLLVAGAFTFAGGTPAGGLVRLQEGGAVDSTFNAGPGANGAILALARAGDGSIFAGGAFTTFAGAAAPGVVKLTADGARASGFSIGTGNANNANPVRALAVAGDGKLIVAGSFDAWAGESVGGIVRLNLDGSRDANFLSGLGTDGPVFALSALSDGRLYVGGAFTALGGGERRGLTRLTATGAIDPVFDVGAGFTGGEVRSIATVADGRVAVGGTFTSYQGASRNRLALLFGSDDAIYALSSDAVYPLEVNPGSPLTLNYGEAINGLRYQWYRDGVRIPGATAASYTIPSAGLSDLGLYTLTFSNGAGEFTTQGIRVTVKLAPVISGAPLTQAVGYGASATFSVGAAGPGPFTYQWYRNGTLISGATGSTYTVSNVGGADFGATFSVRVTNAYGFTDSTPVALTFDTTAVPGALALPFTSPNQWSGSAVQAMVRTAGGQYYVGSGSALLRLNADGTIDSSFAPTLTVSSVRRLAWQSDGKLIVAGNLTIGGVNYRVVRLLTSGAVDPTFAPVAVNYSTASYATSIEALALQTDGKILLGGTFDTVAGTTRRFLARLNTNGTIDTTLAPISDATGPNNTVLSILVQGSNVIIGGTFTAYRGTTVNYLARFIGGTGANDTAFVGGTRADALIRGVSAQADGDLIVFGDFTSYNGTSRARVARLNADGSLDTAFSPGTGAAKRSFFDTPSLTAALPSDNGTVIIVGSFDSFSGWPAVNSVRLTSTGAIDTQWATPGGIANTFNDVFPLSDGSLFATGSLRPATGSALSVARLLSGSYPPQAPAIATAPVAPATEQPAGSRVSLSSLVSGPGTLSFQWYRGTTALTDTTLVSGATTPVLTLRSIRASEAGSYKLRVTSTSNGFVETTPVTVSVGTERSGPGSLDLTWAADPMPRTSPTLAIASDGSAVVSIYDNYNSPSRSFLRKYDANGVLLPTTTFSSGIGFEGSFSDLLVQSDGKIIAIGYHLPPSSTTARYLARMNANGSYDTAYTAAPDNFVQDALLQSDGKLVLVGSFANISGTARAGVARLTTAGAVDTTFTPGAHGLTSLRLVRLATDTANAGKIYIVGYNSTSGSEEIVRLTAAGAIDGTFTRVSTTSNSIRDLVLDSSGRLLVVGSFNAISGQSRRIIARVNVNGTIDTTFGPSRSAGFSATPQSVVIGTDGWIYVSADGSSSTTFDGFPTGSIVRLDATAGQLDVNFPGAGGLRYDSLSQGRLWWTGSKLTLIGYLSGPPRAEFIRLNVDGAPTGAPVLADSSGDRTVADGSALSLFARFSGAGPVTYVWRKDGSILSGAVGPQLVISAVSSTDAGTYTVTATNASGTATATMNVALFAADPLAAVGGFQLTSMFDGGISTMARASDGSVVVGGYFSTVSGVTRRGLARFTTTGALDTTFNNALPFSTTTTPNVYQVIMEPDGRLLVLGSLAMSDGTTAYLIRLNTNGTLANTLLTSTNTVGGITEFARQSDGRIIVMGNFSSILGTARSKLARISSTGVLDTTFVPTGIDASEMVDVKFDSTGRILLVGNFTRIGTTTVATRVVRLSAEGVFDATFQPPSFASTPWGAYYAADGRLFVFGNLGLATGHASSIAQLSETGALNTGFLTPEFVGGMAEDSVGRLHAYGSGKILRLTPTGAIDRSITTSGSATNILGAGSRILVGGGNTPNAVGTTSVFGLVYLNAADTDALSLLTPLPDRLTVPQGGAITLRPSVRGANGAVTYQWFRDGTPISGATGPAFTVASATLAERGSYTYAVTKGGVTVNAGPVQVDVTANSGRPGEVDLAWAPSVPILNATDFVADAANNIFAVGNVTAGSAAPRPLVALTAAGVVRSDFTLSSRVTGQATGLCFQSDGKLLLFGNSLLIDGAQRTIIRLNTDGSLDTTFGTVTDSLVDLVVLDDGRLLAMSNSPTTIYRYSAAGVRDTTYTLTTFPSGKFLPAPNGKKWIVGRHYDSFSDTRWLTRLNADGTPDSTYAGLVAKQSDLVGFATAAPDGGLFVEFSFDSQLSGYGNNYRRILRVRPDGTLDPAFTAGQFLYDANTAYLNDLAVDAAGRLLVAGRFNSYDGISRSGVLRLLPNGAVDPSFVGLPASAITQNDAPLTIAVHPSGRILVNAGTSPLGGVTGRVGLAALVGGELPTSTAPVLAGALADRTLAPYDVLSLNAPVIAPSGAAFQWRRNGVAIPGATDSRYRVDGFAPSAAGDYTVTVSTTGGAVESAPATVSLPPSDYSGGLGANNASLRVETPAAFGVAQPDGRVLMVSPGSFVNSTGPYELYRLNADGTFAGGLPTVITGSYYTVRVSAAVVDAQGRIYVGGDFTSINGVTRNRVARLLADGSVDPTWDPGVGPNSAVTTLALLPDGKLVIGGSFSQVAGTARQFIARLTTTGALDTTFIVGTGFNGVPLVLSAQSDGRVLVGGSFTSYNSITVARLVRLDTVGGLDATFAPAPNSAVRMIQQTSDGRLLIGGDFSQVVGTARTGLAWLDSTGALLPTTMNYTAGYRSALVLADGSVIATTSGNVVRFRADGTSDIIFNQATGYRGIFYLGSSNLSNSSRLTPVLTRDGQVLVVGDVGMIWTQNNADPRISRHAAVWLNYSDAVTPVISTAPVDTELPEGGMLTWTVQARAASGTLTYAWTKVSAPSVVLSTTGSLVLSNVKPSDAGQYRVAVANGEGYAEAFVNLVVRPAGALRPGSVRLGFFAPDINIFYRGAMAGPNGTWWTIANDGRLVRLLANGAMDTSFVSPEMPVGAFTGMVPAPAGGLFLWGSFSTPAGPSAAQIVRVSSAGVIDPAFTTALPNGSTITAVAPLADGRVYVGGTFTVDLAGKSTKNFVRLTATGALDPTFDPNGGVDGTPTAIRPLSDGRIYVAGGLNSAGGSSRRGVVRFLASGALDGSFNNLNVTSVQELVVYPDGRLLIAGPFTSVDGVPRTGVARLTANGVVDPAFLLGAPANFGGSAVPIVLRPDGRIVIAGTFTENGVSRSRVLQFEADGALDASFDGTRSFTSTPNGTSNTVFRSLTLLPTGHLLVAGSFTFLDDGVYRPGLVALQGTPLAPEITADTLNNTAVNSGGTLNFSVTASGAPTLTYQWRLNGNAISGATSAAYAKSSITSGDVGSYDVVVTNTYGSATSRAATVTLNQQAQTISFAPLSDVAFTATPLALSATASSGLTVTFTVQSGNASISGNQLTLLGTGAVTVRASQSGDASWLAASPVDRTFNVTGSFGSWLLDRFTSQEIANATLTGPNADYDKDGIPNLVEYALGLDPKAANSGSGSPVAKSGSDWTFTYQRPADRTDVTYVVQVSTNLTNWTTVGVSHTRLSTANGNETWEARFPTASAPNCFFRLVVTR